MNGTVKFYNVKKRFGFITGEDSKDYFVHLSGVEKGNFLTENSKVEFEVENDEKGPKAVNVKLTEPNPPRERKPRKTEDEEE
ncbi:MAG: cold shock domain-containing protein [Candidatus ainarchaeum sp.]|nr:cold shock domain-containing protein [Candidatus ainarchaeum sp.]